MGLIFFIPSLLGVIPWIALYISGSIVERYDDMNTRLREKDCFFDICKMYHLDLTLPLIIPITSFIIFILLLVYLYKLFSKNKSIKISYIIGTIFCFLTIIPADSVITLAVIKWMRPIVKSDKLEKIECGMPKDLVRLILGKPSKIIIKKSMDEYAFGQGESEKSIKEGWIYEYLLWGGSIEIYFDINGKVLYAGAGYC